MTTTTTASYEPIGIAMPDYERRAFVQIGFAIMAIALLTHVLGVQPRTAVALVPSDAWIAVQSNQTLAAFDPYASPENIGLF